MLDGLPGRQVLRHHPARPAGAQRVEGAIHYLAVGVDARAASTRAGFVDRGQQRLEDGPLTVGEVAGVAIAGHGGA